MTDAEVQEGSISSLEDEGSGERAKEGACHTVWVSANRKLNVFSI